MEKQIETISLKQFSTTEKLALLKELGLQTDGTYVLDNKGQVIKDKYIDVSVELDRMLILPGSLVILDDNELSITRYFEEYGERL